MEAFSHHFHHDSVFQTNTNNNNNATFFTQQITYPSDQHHHQINYTQNMDSKNGSIDYSSSKTVCYYGDGNENVMNSMEENKKNKDGSALNSAKLKDGRETEGKCRKHKICNEGKSKLETKKAKNEKIEEKSKNAEEAPLGYVHVRARRGQATDSHSLAERVRREKISERMKMLQSLVPGCDKITGKALLLEEIINYVQSLQHQVEFLSMKVASFNPMIYDFGVDPNTLMMRSERLNGLASTTSLPFVQQCSPTTQPIVFADSITRTTVPATTFNSPHSSQYSAFDPSTLVQNGHRQISFTEDNESQLWEVDGQKQKLMNLSSLFNNNNMCSFN